MLELLQEDKKGGGIVTDETFYKDKYLLKREAVIDTASFPFWEREASQEVRKYTLDNIDESEPIPEVVQLCICAVAEHLYKCDKQESETGSVISEKDGSWSATYETAKQSEDNKQAKIAKIIFKWLGSTGLLYRGMR